MSYSDYSVHSLDIKDDALILGFPYKFYTIHINTLDKFSIHFGVGGFILDVFITYVICMAILVLIKKLKLINKSKQL